MSAAPSATWQNLIADPLAVRAIGPSEAEVRPEKHRSSYRNASDLRRRPRLRVARPACGSAEPGRRHPQQPKTLGLHADNTAPDSAAPRRGDDARDWHAAGNDGEIDGKFITAGQELSRAIKRVNDQEASIETIVLCVGRFLGDDGNARQQARNALDDQSFGRFIGECDRRSDRPSCAAPTLPTKADLFLRKPARRSRSDRPGAQPPWRAEFRNATPKFPRPLLPWLNLG